MTGNDPADLFPSLAARSPRCFWLDGGSGREWSGRRSLLGRLTAGNPRSRMTPPDRSSPDTPTAEVKRSATTSSPCSTTSTAHRETSGTAASGTPAVLICLQHATPGFPMPSGCGRAGFTSSITRPPITPKNRDRRPNPDDLLNPDGLPGGANPAAANGLPRAVHFRPRASACRRYLRTQPDLPDLGPQRSRANRGLPATADTQPGPLRRIHPTRYPRGTCLVTELKPPTVCPRRTRPHAPGTPHQGHLHLAGSPPLPIGRCANTSPPTRGSWQRT
jgi:hypothetical protein